jgi:hypothetical protein
VDAAVFEPVETPEKYFSTPRWRSLFPGPTCRWCLLE